MSEEPLYVSRFVAGCGISLRDPLGIHMTSHAWNTPYTLESEPSTLNPQPSSLNSRLEGNKEEEGLPTP